jgi:hypothetical protein
MTASALERLRSAREGLDDPGLLLFFRREDQAAATASISPVARRSAEAGRLRLSRRSPAVCTLLMPSASAEAPQVPCTTAGATGKGRG